MGYGVVGLVLPSVVFGSSATKSEVTTVIECAVVGVNDNDRDHYRGKSLRTPHGNEP